MAESPDGAEGGRMKERKPEFILKEVLEEKPGACSPTEPGEMKLVEVETEIPPEFVIPDSKMKLVEVAVSAFAAGKPPPRIAMESATTMAERKPFNIHLFTFGLLLAD